MEELMEIKKTAMEIVPAVPDEIQDKLFRICDLVDCLMKPKATIDTELIKIYKEGE
ncbi:hypothetical protein [Thermoanaerobacterium sp. R66]|uniref:hypothetical protein n=1 Tax=Thermoanaerobacterium sp. R66 TaxID=2742479 RepID=UPI0023804823|nr:hypothetical protein [Thermoanaerobacterium sp. R66]MDE4542281.1 hypothetical protein [Thermoanaerobacterium sp. R66]